MNTKLDKILAEISAGELIDKITILEIKKDKILNENKVKEIDKELNSLNETSCPIDSINEFEKDVNNLKDLFNLFIITCSSSYSIDELFIERLFFRAFLYQESIFLKYKCIR